MLGPQPHESSLDLESYADTGAEPDRTAARLAEDLPIIDRHDAYESLVQRHASTAPDLKHTAGVGFAVRHDRKRVQAKRDASRVVPRRTSRNGETPRIT